MRNGQNKRMRGRNRKSQNPLARVHESNGPDVKIRGTASHIAEKYVQLARDAQASGDPVAAENYYQHAEHYFRMIAAAQEQFRQSQPFYRGESDSRVDDMFDDGDEDSAHPMMGGGEPGYGPREPQPYLRETHQPYPRREPQPYAAEQPSHTGRIQAGAPASEASNEGERLPSFITGGGQPHQSFGPNGHDQPDRFPLHRRRRRHRGPRPEMPSAASAGGDGPDDAGGGSRPLD